MKKNLIWAGVIITLLLVIFFLGRCNGIRSVKKSVTVDTTIRHDSVRIVYQPTPYKVINIDTIKIIKPQPYAVHDTSVSYEYALGEIDTAYFLKLLNQTAYYDTTIKLKRGTLRLIDTVNENRIVGREIKLNSVDTTIKETTILTFPKKTVLYFSVSAFGNKNDLIFGGGIGFILKNKHDVLYSIDYKRIKGQQGNYWGAGIALPLKFKRQ